MKRIILIILDGFGIRTDFFGNAVLKARKPALDYLLANYPAGSLKAAGLAVGLPYNEPGNSEVGHITISAGRIVYQALQRISFAIKDGSFFKNSVLLDAISHAKKNKSRLHFLGLVSSGSVHSYLEHLLALADLAKKENLDDFVLHFISDGKDAKPEEGIKILKSVLVYFKNLGIGRIGSIMGRFYGLDRLGYWERTRAAYNLLVGGQGEKITDPAAYLEISYKNGLTDEFIKPAALISAKESLIKDDDAVIFFNFREDSARQLTRAFIENDFNNFDRKKISNLYFATFTEYEKGLNAKAAFEPVTIKNSLAEVVAQAGLKQLRMAESVKYAHISYFFNCGREAPYQNEERLLIPSTGEALAENNPQLKSIEITEELLKAMKEKKHDLIIVNFANADVLGHTGNFEATVKTIEILDNQLKKIFAASKDWILIITADHGNAEEKIDFLSGEVKTEHTSNNVPFCLVGAEFRTPKKSFSARGGSAFGGELNDLKTIGFLSDAAPTILDLFKIKKPVEMTGVSLLPALTGRP